MESSNQTGSSNASSSTNDQQEMLIHGLFLSTYQVDRWESEGFFIKADLVDGWIDLHWMKFEPVKQSVHLALAIIYVLFFLVGSSSNALVLYIILSTKRLRTPANILIINLAISDLLIIATVPMFVFNSLLEGPAIGKMGCTTYGFITGLGGTSAIMSLAAIAIDRYLVISRPLDVERKPTRCRSLIISLIIWLYSALFAGLPFVGVGRYVPEGYLTSCSFDYLATDWTNRIFILTFFFAAWVFPLTIIILCYIAIFRAVVYVRQSIIGTVNGSHSNTTASSIKKTTKKDESMPIDDVESSRESNGTAQQARFLKEKQSPGIHQANVEVAIAKTVFCLVTTWMVTWTPYAVVALLGISGHAHLITPFGSMLPAMFAKSASCIDPFIYSLNHPKIQREIAVRLYRRFVLRPPGMSNSAAGAGAAMTSTVLVRDLLLRPSLMSHRAVFQRFATNSSSPYYMSKSVDNICNRTDRPVSINSQQRHHQQQTRSCTFTQSLNRS